MQILRYWNASQLSRTLSALPWSTLIEMKLATFSAIPSTRRCFVMTTLFAVSAMMLLKETAVFALLLRLLVRKATWHSFVFTQCFRFTWPISEKRCDSCSNCGGSSLANSFFHMEMSEMSEKATDNSSGNRR